MSATNGSANSAEVNVTITLPTPWIADDIGNVGIGGHTIYTGGVFQLTGSNSTDTGDGFQFAYRNVTGDCTIIAKIDSQSLDTGYGAVMLRNSTSATSRYVRMDATADDKNHMFFYYRSSDGGTSTYAVGYQAVPVWVKLTRVGNLFTGYFSADRNFMDSGGIQVYHHEHYQSWEDWPPVPCLLSRKPRHFSQMSV